MLEQAQELSESPEAHLFDGALTHLKEFCQVTEREHFTPFTNEQLQSPVNDAHTDHLVWLTREVLRAGVTSELVVEAGRLGAGYDTAFFYGQNVIIGGVRLWFGYWPKAWRQWPHDGPLWLQVYGRDATSLLKTGAFRDARHLPQRARFSPAERRR